MKKNYRRKLLSFCLLLFITLFSGRVMSDNKTVSSDKSGVPIAGKWTGKSFAIKNNVLQIRGGHVYGYFGDKSWTDCKIKLIVKKLAINPNAYFLIRPRAAWEKKFYQVQFRDKQINLGYMLRNDYKPMVNTVKYELPSNKNTVIEISMSDYKMIVKIDSKTIATYNDSEKLIDKGRVLFFFNKCNVDISEVSVNGKAAASSKNEKKPELSLFEQYKRAPNPYRKDLCLDAVLFQQLKAENILRIFKQWGYDDSKLNDLYAFIGQCEQFRREYQNIADKNKLERVKSFYEKNISLINARKRELFLLFKKQPEKKSIKPESLRIGELVLQYRDYSQEEIDNLVFNLVVNGGYNLIKIDKMRQLMTDKDTPGISNLWPHPANLGNIKKIVKAAHKLGVMTNIHLTSAFIPPEVLEAHPDWALINIATGKPYTNKYYKGPGVVCFNNPDFQKPFLQKIKNLFSETDLDSLNIDEIQFFLNTCCGCKYCRKDFKQACGIDIPPFSDDEFWKKHDERYRKWKLFRENTRNRFLAKLLKTAGRKVYLFHYLSMPAATYGTQSSAVVYEADAAVAGATGIEAHGQGSLNPWLYYNNWKAYFSELQYVQSVANKFGNMTWNISYPQLPREDYYKNPLYSNFIPYGHPDSETFFIWALCKTAGNHNWFRRRYVVPSLFEQKYDNIFAGDAKHINISASIGIYYSRTMKSLYSQIEDSWHKVYYWEMRAWADRCAALNIPYNILLEGSLTYDKLKKYSLIILPNTAFMSEKQAMAIKKYVNSGGTVVATHETSLYTLEGKKRPGFLLHDLIGYASGLVGENKYRGTITYSEPVCSKIFGATENLPATTYDGYIMLLKSSEHNGKKPDVLGVYKNINAPAILYKRYGDGNFFYMAGKLALETIRTPEVSTKQKFIAPDSAITTLCDNILTKYNINPPWKVINKPDGVFVNVLKNGENGYRCYLLNVKGAEMKAGNPGKVKLIDYKTVQEKNAKLLINTVEKINTCYGISPDFPGKIKVPFKTVKNGIQIELPIDKLYRFLIIIAERNS